MVQTHLPFGERDRIISLALCTNPRLVEPVTDEDAQKVLTCDALYLKKLTHCAATLFGEIPCERRNILPCLVGAVLTGDLCLAMTEGAKGKPLASPLAVSKAYDAFYRATREVSSHFRSVEQSRHTFPEVSSLYCGETSCRLQKLDDSPDGRNIRQELDVYLHEKPRRHRAALQACLSRYLVVLSD